MMQNFAVIILAKDEEATVVRCLSGIFSQSLFAEPDNSFTVLVVANGCTDDTVGVASGYLNAVELPKAFGYKIVDLKTPGKSRAWNHAVHELLAPEVDYVFFIDSDVELLDNSVFGAIYSALLSRPDKSAFVGRPMKNNERKNRRSLLERVATMISNKTRHVDAINGSLYLADADLLRTIWLPDLTPGEDGFLNAMIESRSFTAPGAPSLVAQSATGTHYYEDVSVGGFYSHERRIIVATVINNWLFEYFWGMGLAEPAGTRIRSLNVDNPDWVQGVIDDRVRGRWWVVPRGVVLSRFNSVDGLGISRWLRRFPFALGATIISLPSIVAANRLLRRRGAAAHW